MNEVKTEKIEDLNLVALRKYACPRINSQKDWYLKCMDCKGLDGCPAGKRAMQIIEQETTPSISTESNKPFDEKTMAILEKSKTNSKGAKYAEAVIKGGDDPADWLVQHGYFNIRWKATDGLKKWAKSHGLPMSMIHLEEKPYLTIRTEKVRESIESIFSGTKNTKERIESFLNSEKNLNYTGHTLSQRLRVWSDRYSDLNKKYGIKELCLIFGTQNRRNMTVDDLRKELLEEDAPINEENDEVSVEDFLMESAPDIVELSNIEKEEPRPEPAKEAGISAQQLLRVEFGKKRLELKNRMAYISQQILQLSECQKGLEEQLRTLDSAAKLFGMKPAGDISQQ